jgi:hypothetical protein
MDPNAHRPNCPYCVGIAALIQRFRRMSWGADQWIARPVSGLFVSVDGEVRRFALAAFSNADPSDLPNPLVYSLPLTIHRNHPEAEPELLVCFAPETVVPLAKGLYLEDGDLRYDALEDWHRFWQPIKKCVFAPQATSNDLECHKRGNVDRFEHRRQTLEGVSYEDSLRAYVSWWGQSKESIQDAIQW